MDANSVVISLVLNGWKAKVGCQEVVFSNVDQLCSELKLYLTDPPSTQKRYLSEAVNSRWTAGPQVPEAPRPAREDERIRMARDNDCAAQSQEANPNRLVAGRGV